MDETMENCNYWNLQKQKQNLKLGIHGADSVDDGEKRPGKDAGLCQQKGVKDQKRVQEYGGECVFYPVCSEALARL